MGAVMAFSMFEKRNGVHVATRPYALFAVTVVVLLVICSVYWFTYCDRKLVLVVALAFAFIPVMLFLLNIRGLCVTEHRRLTAYGSALGLSCLLFAVVFPPFSVADEYHHYLSSYWLSECITGEAEWVRPETISMRADDWELYSNHGTSGEDFKQQQFTIDAAAYQRVFDEFSLGRQQQDEVSVPSYAMFSFTLGDENAIAKLGSVVGILLAKLLGLGAYPLFYLGRIFSAAFFVACAVAAVSITPVGKNVFMAISLLPMTLQLAGSYSYDGGTIGLSFVFIALALKAMMGEEKLNCRDFFALAVFAVLLSPCKAVYVLEVGLVLFIPSRRFSSKRNALMIKIGILALAAASVAVAKLSTVASVSSGTTTFAFPGERTYSFSDLLSNPLATLSLFFRTFDAAGDSYWMTAIGSNLGWLQQNIGMPAFLMGAYVIALLYSAQRSKDDPVEMMPWQRVLFLAIAGAVWLAVMLSMVVSWTPMTSPTIQGVQGRYILPALPLLFLTLRSKRLVVLEDGWMTSLAVPAVLNAIFMIRLMGLVLVA